MPIVNSYQMDPTALADFAEETGYLQEKARQIAQQKAYNQRLTEMQMQWGHEDQRMAQQAELALEEHRLREEAAEKAWRRNMAATAAQLRQQNSYRAQAMADQFENEVKLRTIQERAKREASGWQYSPTQERQRMELQQQMETIRNSDILTPEEKQAQMARLNMQMKTMLPEVQPKKSAHKLGEIWKADDGFEYMMTEKGPSFSPRQQYINDLNKLNKEQQAKETIAKIHSTARLEAEQLKQQKDQQKTIIIDYDRQKKELENQLRDYERHVAPNAPLRKEIDRIDRELARYDTVKEQYERAKVDNRYERDAERQREHWQRVVLPLQENVRKLEALRQKRQQYEQTLQSLEKQYNQVKKKALIFQATKSPYTFEKEEARRQIEQAIDKGDIETEQLMKQVLANMQGIG